MAKIIGDNQCPSFRSSLAPRGGPLFEKPAIGFGNLKKRQDVWTTSLDCAIRCRFFDQPLTPAMPGRPAFENEAVQRWTAGLALRTDMCRHCRVHLRPAAVLKMRSTGLPGMSRKPSASSLGFGRRPGACSSSAVVVRKRRDRASTAPIRSSVHIPVST